MQVSKEHHTIVSKTVSSLYHSHSTQQQQQQQQQLTNFIDDVESKNMDLLIYPVTHYFGDSLYFAFIISSIEM